MTNAEFITQNKEQDVRSLALKKVPEGVDLLWCLTQIEGYQLAKKKLPQWAATDGLHYPPRLSMEQCSSEATALYKQQIVRRLLGESPTPSMLIDITGGFGVDFSYMAKAVSRAVYVERQQLLCDAAKHNMPLLGLPNAQIVCGDGTEWFSTFGSDDSNKQPTDTTTIVFADPARRDDVGRKTVAIEDCTPDICTHQQTILSKAQYLIVKLSPMLDISQALRSLRNVTEVHTVSVKGECKELLFVMQQSTLSPEEKVQPTALTEGIRYYCANLDTPDETFSCTARDVEDGRARLTCCSPDVGITLYEPNASILKAGVQEAMASRYGLQKLHPCSNLYVGAEADNLPARRFVIEEVLDFSKASQKKLRTEVKQANLTVRNFPSTVDDLRKRLKLKDGGNVYLFATTQFDDTHILLKTKKK